ncbi:hypothetical protein ACRAKI_09880 [Saccharothrix isguenensis]
MPRTLRSKIVLVAVLALVTGCSTTVTGSGSGTEPVGATTTKATTATTKAVTTTAEERTPEPDPRPVPTVDEGAPAQYCDEQFTGALGKPMLAVVVETPSGRLTCDQAAAILFDYYAERRDPTPGLPPLTIGPMSCNQVPEPAMPQVVCSDDDNIIYSMWPQT